MFTTYNILKAIHVLAAVTWVGGAISFNILGTRLKNGANPRTLGDVAREFEFIGTRVFLPTSLILFGLGIWMVIISGWNFTDLWILIGLAGIVATIITGSAVIGPRSKRLGETLEVKSPEDPDVQRQIGELIAYSRIDLVVLIIVVLDMVIKPGV